LLALLTVLVLLLITLTSRAVLNKAICKPGH
jgi:hypothetical protein